MEPRVPFCASDDHPLAGRLFFPPEGTTARGVVLISGATAVPQGFYARFARHLAATHRFAVFTYDYRGIGESRGDTAQGMSATLRDWGERDFTGAVRWAQARFPGLPLLGVCHSFGGHTLAMSDAAHHLSGAVAFGTQLAWVGRWPLQQRLRLEATLRILFPLLTATSGYLPASAGLGVDLPSGVALQWARWYLQRHYFLDAHPEYGERLSQLRFPVRLYGADDDDYAPASGIRAFADQIPGAEVRILSPQEPGRPIGHLSVFRPEQAALLWDELGALLVGWATRARATRASA